MPIYNWLIVHLSYHTFTVFLYTYSDCQIRNLTYFNSERVSQQCGVFMYLHQRFEGCVQVVISSPRQSSKERGVHQEKSPAPVEHSNPCQTHTHKTHSGAYVNC